MKKKLKGFTLIEVALFLAVTGALFVGIAVGTQNSIFQQRYTDAVQNFAEFLRTAYSEVLNVQSEGTGKSNKIIYGKLITFGETNDLSGCAVNGNDRNRESRCTKDPGTVSIFTYNVIANASDGSISGNILDIMRELDANVVIQKEDGYYSPVGFPRDYVPKWASAIQVPDSNDNYVGSILILRHPRSGVVYTFVMDDVAVGVNSGTINANDRGLDDFNPLREFLAEEGHFVVKQVDFCVNPNGVNEGGLRSNVRIGENARNSSAIEVIGDSETCRF